MIAQDHIATLQGATVFDRDGDKIGSLGQVYLDTSTNQPSWASVNTGLFGLKESLVPIADADETADGIRVPFDKKTVKDAPNVDVSHDEPLMPDDVVKLYEHYNVGGSGSTSSGSTSSGFDETGNGRTGYDSGAAQAGTVGTPDSFTPDRDRTDRDLTDRSTGDRQFGTDDAMTRSEERLNVGTERDQVGKARLRKYVVTENVRTTVPVSREEVRKEQIDTDIPGRDDDRLR